MRKVISSIVLLSLYLPSLAQSQQPDAALLARTRALYDAPFTRTLVSFDCAVQFDWKDHFMKTIGQIPPAAIPTLERLQSIAHRVSVNRSGAVVSATPKTTDLTGIPHGADLEQGFQTIVASGLNEWLPFATNVILPVGSTKFGFSRQDADYKLVMSGTNMAATLMLATDMRIASVVSQLPEPLRFATQFVKGPEGYLLESVKSSSDISSSDTWESAFGYAYKAVQGFELPSAVTVTQENTKEAWQYSLSDCKAITGIEVKVEAPKR